MQEDISHPPIGMPIHSIYFVHNSRGVLVLLKFYWAPDIVEFVLGRFSHFNIAIAYSNSTFCGAWTPSFCEFTQNFSKTSTPQVSSGHLAKLKNRINMTRNYVGYFKTCLMALILSLSKIYPRLLILSVVEFENLNLCDECSHCSLWGHSLQIFSLSHSTTYNKKRVTNSVL